MAKSNMNTIFEDDAEKPGTDVTEVMTGKASKKPMSDAERDHQRQDILHKLFVIQAVHAHVNATKANKGKKSVKAKGVLNNGS